MKNKSLVSSFRNAMLGFSTVFREERNMRVHAVTAAAVIVAGVLLKVDGPGFALLIISIVLVISTELINSSIEYAINMFTDGRQNPMAKKAKDAAAGACFVCALFSVIVGIAVLLPRIAGLFMK